MVPDAKAVRRSVFWTLCIMGFFAILSSTMSKNPVLGPFSASLGTPPEWTGLVSAASTIPGILVSLPAASLSDILGRRKFLLMAGFLFASAPFFYLFITAWWQLILIRFYHGFATAIFVPVAEASIAESFPAKRGERISLFSSATYVGRVIAPILGGTILQITNSSFNILYVGVALAGLAAFCTGLLFMVEGKNPSVSTKKENLRTTLGNVFQGWGQVVSNRGVLIGCFVQAAQYYAFGSLEFYLSKYLREFLEFDWLLTAVITGSLVAIPIVAKPYMGRASDKIGRRIPIIVGSVVSVFPLLAMPFTADFGILLVLSVTYGLGFAIVTSSTPALVTELAPSQLVGASMGFLDTLMDVGQTLGSLVSGLIFATSLGYVGVFPSLGFILSISCLVFALSRTKNHT